MVPKALGMFILININYIYIWYYILIYIYMDDITARYNKHDASINNSNSHSIDDRNNDGNNNVNLHCIEYIEELMIISDDKWEPMAIHETQWCIIHIDCKHVYTGWQGNHGYFCCLLMFFPQMFSRHLLEWFFFCQRLLAGIAGPFNFRSPCCKGIPFQSCWLHILRTILLQTCEHTGVMLWPQSL